MYAWHVYPSSCGALHQIIDRRYMLLALYLCCSSHHFCCNDLPKVAALAHCFAFGNDLHFWGIQYDTCSFLIIGNAGFNAHDRPLPSARMVLDEMSQQNTPSRWLEEASSQPKPAQQLGTLGGGNHFLEVCFAPAPVPILCTVSLCRHPSIEFPAHRCFSIVC